MGCIVFEGVTKRFGSNVVVDGLNLTIEDGEFVTLLGPSGCGKTTTLRMLAGFAQPNAGTIMVDGRVYSSPGFALPPERRLMGMVFQNYAVWPHMTVYQNVAFGLEVLKKPGDETRDRVTRILEIVGLKGLEKRYPGQLSGGQQQRVALARSLVVEPSILLLDEPLSNLDAKLREHMRWELKELQKRIGITFVYVTHDQAEAMALSDRVAVMSAGKLQQYGPPREIYQKPSNRMVADFMGLVNLIPARVLGGQDGRWQLSLGSQAAVTMAIPFSPQPGADLMLAVRPENVRLGEGSLKGVVQQATFLGNLNDYQLEMLGTRVRVQAHPLEIFDVGQEVSVSINLESCTLLA
ncbi:MAG: ABC transporter ATP-binding protein [Chloroflexi bacterium]|nr:ABC transporter ATP-binding protein [Chloroflexota bacterium]